MNKYFCSTDLSTKLNNSYHTDIPDGTVEAAGPLFSGPSLGPTLSPTSAMFWSFLTQHNIGLAEVDTLIIPDLNTREMEHHLKIIYLTGNLSTLYQCMNSFVISEDLKLSCTEDHENRNPVFSTEDSNRRRRIVKDLEVREKSELCCGECGRKFSRKDHLKRHSLTHSGEKPHICNICDSRFTRVDALQLHKVNCQIRNESASELLTITGKSEEKLWKKSASCFSAKLLIISGAVSSVIPSLKLK